jgi:hypothetical protein
VPAPQVQNVAANSSTTLSRDSGRNEVRRLMVYRGLYVAHRVVCITVVQSVFGTGGGASAPTPSDREVVDHRRCRPLLGEDNSGAGCARSRTRRGHRFGGPMAPAQGLGRVRHAVPGECQAVLLHHAYCIVYRGLCT